MCCYFVCFVGKIVGVGWLIVVGLFFWKVNVDVFVFKQCNGVQVGVGVELIDDVGSEEIDVGWVLICFYLFVYFVFSGKLVKLIFCGCRNV